MQSWEGQNIKKELDALKFGRLLGRQTKMMTDRNGQKQNEIK